MSCLVASVIIRADDGIDLTKSDEEDGANTKTRKALGIPEMDPDALPSALTQKFLILTC